MTEPQLVALFFVSVAVGAVLAWVQCQPKAPDEHES